MYGNIKIAARFPYASDFRCGLALVRVGNEYGFINHDGDFVIPPRFISAEDFQNGLCYVESTKTVGYINVAGEFVWQGPYVESRRGSLR